MWRNRLKSAGCGLVAILIAIFIMYRSFQAPEAGPSKTGGGWLFIFAPTLLIIGVVVAFRALVHGSHALSGRNLLYSGLLMLVVGAFPWAYTSLIIRDRGMEGSGMLGTIIFLFIGVPGIFVTIVGFFLRDWGPD